MDDDAPPGVPEWVVTYGDMMSLLLTFFIMLVSLSELKSDNGKLRAALDSISEAFGATPGNAGVPGSSLQQTSVLNKRFSLGSRSEGGLESASRKSKGAAGPHATAQVINHGTVITLGGPAVFPGDSVELNPRLEHDLNVVSGELAYRPNLIVVRGHAARGPVSPDTLSDVESILGRSGIDKVDVSFSRALAVSMYMKLQGINDKRLRIDAAGDAEPRHSSRDKKLQELNHRVDVFAIDSYIPRPE
jgi:chemotaxis protein MotB